MPARAAIPLDRRQLLAAVQTFRRGDLSARLPVGPTGIDGEITEAFNDIVFLSERMTREFGQLREMVGKLG